MRQKKKKKKNPNVLVIFVELRFNLCNNKDQTWFFNALKMTLNVPNNSNSPSNSNPASLPVTPRKPFLVPLTQTTEKIKNKISHT